jgi:SWI/SNF-related matrix-associated actin-dependent regulator of chromatin subfamily A member 5
MNRTAVSRRKKTALANSSKGGKKRRMTEKEEDDIIMQDEMNQSEDIVPVVTRLEKQPANIKNGTMRDYQLEGLNWLISLRKAGISGILADEMGLGKTLQSISILAYLKLFQNVTGPHLVVVPLTTLGNWCNEFKKWCPSMKVFRFHGDKEERKAMLRDDLDPNNRKWEVVVTSYEMVIKHKTQLSRYNWEYIVVDEAHRLKNENSSLSKVMRMFTSVTRLLITGTPLQNNLHELWALLNFLLPNVFDNPDEFDALFQAGEDEEASIAQAKAMKQLHHLLRPFMLRRLKADVEKSLLPKKEVLVFVGMSELQKKLYLSIYHKNMDAVRGITVQKTALLNTIMQLRKCANHPYLFDGVEDRTLDVYGDHLYKVCGKLTVLDKLLTKLKARGSRVLIFSQMTRVLDILEDYCAIKKHAYCRIDGSTSTLDREAAMKTYK